MHSSQKCRRRWYCPMLGPCRGSRASVSVRTQSGRRPGPGERRRLFSARRIDPHRRGQYPGRRGAAGAAPTSSGTNPGQGSVHNVHHQAATPARVNSSRPISGTPAAASAPPPRTPASPARPPRARPRPAAQEATQPYPPDFRRVLRDPPARAAATIEANALAPARYARVTPRWSGARVNREGSFTERMRHLTARHDHGGPDADVVVEDARAEDE